MAENRGETMVLPKRLRYDPNGGYLWDDEFKNKGPIMAFDLPRSEGDSEGLARVRGYGYLTGAGGLNFSDEEACAYMDRMGRQMERCWNLFAETEPDEAQRAHFEIEIHALLDEAGIPDQTQDGTLLNLRERFQVVHLHTLKFAAAEKPEEVSA